MVKIENSKRPKKISKNTVKIEKPKTVKKEKLKNFKNIEIENFDIEVKSEIKANRVNRVNLDIDSIPSETDLDITFQILEKNYDISHEVLSKRVKHHADMSKNVNRQLNYIGFVYYIWNPDNLNIKIIPLLLPYAILDIVNLQEFYYLQRPSMFIDGTPIWIVIRGIPVSFALNLTSVNVYDNENKAIVKKNLGTVIREIELEGFTPSELRAKLKSMYSTYVFGKPSLGFKEYLMVVLAMFGICLLEYIILSSIFRGF